MVQYGIVTHGGVGSPPELSDGCKAACEAGFLLIRDGKTALHAVVEAVRVLEDDGRYNAGSGSVLRLDGRTIEMDAAVMDSGGALGMVISVRGVKNPVLLAKAVSETPHVALSGEGASRLARRLGFQPFYHVSMRALDRHRRIRELMAEGRLAEENPLWQGHDVRPLWNFPDPECSTLFSCDTVGAVALDRNGGLAVAVSTGGAAPMLLGRVGDSPMIGCGFYSGPAGAVAATGVGEEIIKRMLAKEVYEMISEGRAIEEATEWGIGMFPDAMPAGMIALSRNGHAVSSNRDMAHAVLVKEV